MTESELIEQTALRVGMKSLMNHGAASRVYSKGCNGVTQEHLLAFTREVALHCALALASSPAPIDMVLHCPKCGMQHIDAKEFNSTHVDRYPSSTGEDDPAVSWSNPPHRSHLCHGCNHIWRPADVPTNGVKAVKTTGSADSPLASSPAAEQPANASLIPAEFCKPATAEDIEQWGARINAAAASAAVPSLTDEEAERQTLAAFAHTVPSHQIEVLKYWFKKGLKQGAALAALPQTEPTLTDEKPVSALKDGQVAALVNELRDIAIKFHDAGQLRERIARVIRPLFPKVGAAAPAEEFQYVRAGSLCLDGHFIAEKGRDDHGFSLYRRLPAAPKETP